MKGTDIHSMLGMKYVNPSTHVSPRMHSKEKEPGNEQGDVKLLKFSTLSQGLEDDIFQTSFGWWAVTAASYCPGRCSQIVLKSMTKHHEREEKHSVQIDTYQMALLNQISLPHL